MGQMRWPIPSLHGLATIVALTAGLLGLSGCEAIGDASRSGAQLRIIDAAADAGSVSVYGTSTGLAYNLEFGTVTSYIPVSASTQTLRVRGSGERTQAALHTSLMRSQPYTLLLSETPEGVQSTLLADQAAPAPQGQTALRFVNTSVHSAGVDLYVIPQGVPLLPSLPLMRALAAGVSTAYLNLPAGPNRIVALPAGVPLSNAGSLLGAISSEVLVPMSARTLVIADSPVKDGGAGLKIVAATDYDPAVALLPR